MLRVLARVFAVFLLLNVHLMHAQEIVAIDDAKEQYIFTFDNLVYLEDAEGNLTFAEVQQKKLQNEIKTNTLYAPHYHLSFLISDRYKCLFARFI